MATANTPVVVVPTLSITGWARTPEDMAYYLFAYLYEADKNQSTIYGKNVCTLAYLNATYGKDIPEFCGQLRTMLETYLGRHFDQVNVDITHDDTAGNTGSLVNVYINSTVYKNGRKYSFGHLVQKNGQVAKLLTLVNGDYI